ncbi:MAG: hypothetical protein HKN31_12485, partial [Pricia sp.]|nr:hypothetical protein [Pricia sp.]
LEELAFDEASGFRLKQTSLTAQLDDSSASLSNFELQTNKSLVSGDLEVKYPSVDELIDSPENTQISLDISDLNVTLQDFLVFQPSLSENEYLKKAAQKPFRGMFSAQGTLASFEIPDLKIDWGQNTSLEAVGELNNITQTDLLSFDFSTIEVTSNRADLLQFVSENELGISVPNTILVNAELKGTIDDMYADATLKIPEGSANLTGNYNDQGEITFDANLEVDSLRLDQLLKNEQLGGVSFTLDANGSGNNLSNLDATFTSDFTQLQLKGYDFSNLSLQGEIDQGEGNINLDFKDNNLNFKSITRVNLDSVNSKINLDLNIIGADLYALGLTKEDIKAGVKLNANFEGNVDDFSLDAVFSEGIAVYENEQYQLGDIDLTSHIGANSSEIAINSNFLNGTAKSNAAPDKITMALQKQFKGYFSDSIVSDTVSNPVQLKVDMALSRVPVLTKVFFRGIERLDSVTVKAEFDATTKNLNSNIFIPSITYNGISVDSLSVLVNGTATDLDFSAGLSDLQLDPIAVKRTYFEGNLKNRELRLDFSSFDDEERLMHIASEMTLNKDTVQLHINPSELIFNRKEWSVPMDNRISITENFLRFQNMVLNRNGQELAIGNSLSGFEKDHIGITFDNFKLQTFLSLLNPDEALVAGLVKGRFVLVEPYGATGIVADFNIDQLEVLQTALGNLSLDASSKGLSAYDFNLAVKDGNLDLDLVGDYTAAESGAKLNLDLDLNKLELEVIEGLTEGAIVNSNGNISGNVKVRGTTTEPIYEGKLTFNQTDFRVASLNADIKISEETVRVDNSGFYFDDFGIQD